VKQSTIANRNFDKNDPNWLFTTIQTDTLEDEAELFNLGFEVTTTFFELIVGSFFPSNMANYPYDYKFTSIEFMASPKTKVYQRETYDLLMALGDIGGVNEALTILIGSLIGGFAMISEQSLLAKYRYKYNTEKKDSEIAVQPYLEGRYFYNLVFCCCKD